MKLSGISGKGTGKKGSDVYVISGGEQIVRQYNPVVSNPNTPAQVTQRARLKLASQLAAAYAPVIVIPKQGLVSARNAWMKKNFDLIVGAESGAYADLPNIQLTAGLVGLPAVVAQVDDNSTLSVNLASDARPVASRIVYNVFAKTTEEKLVLVDSKVVNASGDDGTFPTSFTTDQTDLLVYAYGMKDASSIASAKYGNYRVQSGEDIARLMSNRKLSSADFTFTQTRGVNTAGWINPFPGRIILAYEPGDEYGLNSDNIVDGVLEGLPNRLSELKLDLPDGQYNVVLTGLTEEGITHEVSLTKRQDYWTFIHDASLSDIYKPYEVRVDGRLYFKTA